MHVYTHTCIYIYIYAYVYIIYNDIYIYIYICTHGSPPERDGADGARVAEVLHRRPHGQLHKTYIFLNNMILYICFNSINLNSNRPPDELPHNNSKMT